MSKQTNTLLSTTDAQVWAEEFMKNFGNRLDEIDFGLMVSWFANAIETGRSNGTMNWEDQGSIDCDMYTSLECFVAGAISTMPPFDDKYSPRALPYARKALEAAGTWTPDI